MLPVGRHQCYGGPLLEEVLHLLVEVLAWRQHVLRVDASYDIGSLDVVVVEVDEHLVALVRLEECSAAAGSHRLCDTHPWGGYAGEDLVPLLGLLLHLGLLFCHVFLLLLHLIAEGFLLIDELLTVGRQDFLRLLGIAVRLAEVFLQELYLLQFLPVVLVAVAVLLPRLDVHGIVFVGYCACATVEDGVGGHLLQFVVEPGHLALVDFGLALKGLVLPLEVGLGHLLHFLDHVLDVVDQE